MTSCKELLRILRTGEGDNTLLPLYAPDGSKPALEAARGRAVHVTEAFIAQFGGAQPAALFSGPGRTEIGGNHTDHQHGHVLCGSVDLDTLAHDHFQGGRYTFAMEKAPVETPFTFPGFEDVEAGIVKWPMSVVRITAGNPDRLEWSDTAAQVARDYSKWMANDNFMGHYGPDGTDDPADRLEAAGIDWSEVAENLDGGATDGADAYNDWVSEPGHRANLLHEWVTHLGVGGYYKPSGTTYRFYWTQDFYEPSSYDFDW